MDKNRNKAKNKRNYQPNFYPVNQRFAFLVLSILLLAFTIAGACYNDLPMPERVHLHDLSVWVMLAAFISAAVNLLSFFIDHYDKRDNEHKYEKFANFSKKAGWILFVGALIVHIIDLILNR